MHELAPKENSEEKAKEDLVSSCTSFVQLAETIRIIGAVQGTRKLYYPDELIRKIEQVRHGHRTLEFVTRTYGIRSKVESMLETDLVYKKYVLRKEKNTRE